jgi:hypothetical protein
MISVWFIIPAVAVGAIFGGILVWISVSSSFEDIRRKDWRDKDE